MRFKFFKRLRKSKPQVSDVDIENLFLKDEEEIATATTIEVIQQDGEEEEEIDGLAATATISVPTTVASTKKKPSPPQEENLYNISSNNNNNNMPEIVEQHSACEGDDDDTTNTTPSSINNDQEEEKKYGYHEWLRIRNEWTKGTCDNGPTSVEEFENFPNSKLRDIPDTMYPKMYKMLVKENRPLKEPLNLADAFKIIKSGWQEDGTWPTE